MTRLSSAIAFLTASALVLGGPRNLTSQAPPAGVTAKCGDGTYSKAKNKQGACSKHKGVAEWYGTGTTAQAKPAPAAPAPAVPADATATAEEPLAGAIP